GRPQADGVGARIRARWCAAEMHEKRGRVRRCDASGVFGHGIYEIVANIGEVVRFPIITPAERLAGIQHGLMLHERLRCDRVSEWPREALERQNHVATFGWRAGPAARDGRSR